MKTIVILIDEENSETDILTNILFKELNKEYLPIPEAQVLNSIYRQLAHKEHPNRFITGEYKLPSLVPLSRLDLSVRTINFLGSVGIRNIGELTNKTESELFSKKGFGYGKLNKIKESLAFFGLFLKKW